MKYIACRFSQNYASQLGNPLAKLEMFDDIINLSLGDPDIPVDERIIAAASKAMSEGRTHYEVPQGVLSLRKEIIKFHKEEYDQDINLDEVLVTTSASHAMYMVLMAILNEGDEIIIPSPYFSSYKEQVELNGGKCVFLNTYQEDNFEVREDLLREKINQKTKAIIVNTPNNPTGACYSIDNLKMIARVAEENGILIIADDIYTTFLNGGNFYPISLFVKEASNVVTIRSFSKDYSMTGFRIGYIVGDSNLLKVILSINDSIIFTTPGVSQYAAIEALKIRKEIKLVVQKNINERLNYAYKRIKESNYFSAIEPKGGMYIYMNIKKTGLSSKEFEKYVFEKAHVLLLNGCAFGENGEGYVRLAMTCNVEMLKEAFDRLETLDYNI